MSNWLVTLLLPLAAWTGWWIGMRKEARDLRLSKSREIYFEGLSFLLNDQTDQALEVFLSMAEIDQQTFDNQLTLGALFRKRGELDRALHLHKQLADYPDLAENQRHAVTYELAKDYARAGMYAHSCDILEPLQEANFKRREVLIELERIYERTKDWASAISVAERWKASGYGDRSRQIAQYYCEIARKALEDKRLAQSAAALDEALHHDGGCSRAYWIRAQLAELQGEYVTAIHSYQSIAEQEVDFVPEILPSLEHAYQQIGREPEYCQWLEKTEAAHPYVRLTLKVVELLARRNPVAAKALIEKRLQGTRNPLLLAQYLNYSDNPAAAQIYHQVGRQIAPQTLYQCDECGFRQQRLIWHCPSCQAWASFRPVIELKLEQR